MDVQSLLKALQARTLYRNLAGNSVISDDEILAILRNFEEKAKCSKERRPGAQQHGVGGAAGEATAAESVLPPEQPQHDYVNAPDLK